MTARPPRVGLVLGAGGIAGHSFHAGVLRALEEVTGWDPRSASLVVGTSAGSIVGAALRSGMSAPELYTEATTVPTEEHPGYARRPDRWRPLPSSLGLGVRMALRPFWTLRPGVLTAAWLPEGRLAHSIISEGVAPLVEGRPAEPGDLWVTAVRLDTGRRVVFGHPDDPGLPEGWTWEDAVTASCAIPGVFAPVVVDGVRLIDGGAHSPTNADLARHAELDALVVLSPMSAVRPHQRAAVDAPVRAWYRRRLASEVAPLRRKGLPVLVFQPTREVLGAMGLNAMDPNLRVPVAEASYEAALRRFERERGEAVEALCA